MGNIDANGGLEWKMDSSGLFTTKSAYMMMMNLSNTEGEQSVERKLQGFWKKVWKCNLPGRIKVFVQRLFHNALPDGYNLRRRGSLKSSEGDCQSRGFNVESALHIVKECWKAAALWRRVGIDVRCLEWSRGNAADWLYDSANFGDNTTFKKIMGARGVCGHAEMRYFTGKGMVD